MARVETDDKEAGMLEDLRAAFPGQHVRISLIPISDAQEQTIVISEGEDPIKLFIRIGREFLNDICRKPKRIKTLQIIKDNPDSSAKEIGYIYNFNSEGGVKDDNISAGSLHENLNFLRMSGYIVKREGRPAKYRLSKNTEIVIAISAVAREIGIGFEKKKIKEIKNRLREMGGEI